MPNENDDDDHAKIITSTVTATASTATVPPSPEKTHDDTVPDGSAHPPRPTKPSTEDSDEGPSETEEEEATGTNVAQEATPTAASSSWVSWLPTFGASKKAQIWIYGSVGLIVAFCIGLGIYLFIARRRRLRNDTRNNYEFEMLDEEEGEGLNSKSAEKNLGGEVSGRGSRRTRGGELYDAFAGGSDDEDEFDRYSDRERGVDTPPSGSGGVVDDDDDENRHFALGDESDEDEKEERRPLR